MFALAVLTLRIRRLIAPQFGGSYAPTPIPQAVKYAPLANLTLLDILLYAYTHFRPLIGLLRLQFPELSSRRLCR